MTWRQLLEQLKSMEKVSHTSLDKQVCFIGDDIIPVDVFESLTSGDTYLMTSVVSNEDGEDD